MIFLQEPVELKCNSPLTYTAVLSKVFLQTGKSLRENVERVLWVMVVFTVAWLNLKAFQRGWKKQHKRPYSFFLFPWCWTLNLNQAKTGLLQPIMPIDIFAYSFTLLWDNLCQNSLCYYLSIVLWSRWTLLLLPKDNMPSNKLRSCNPPRLAPCGPCMWNLILY